MPKGKLFTSYFLQQAKTKDFTEYFLHLKGRKISSGSPDFQEQFSWVAIDKV